MFFAARNSASSWGDVWIGMGLLYSVASSTTESQTMGCGHHKRVRLPLGRGELEKAPRGGGVTGVWRPCRQVLSNGECGENADERHVQRQASTEEVGRKGGSVSLPALVGSDGRWDGPCGSISQRPWPLSQGLLTTAQKHGDRPTKGVQSGAAAGRTWNLVPGVWPHCHR